MSLENSGVFQFLKEVTLRLLCHSSTASVCGSFTRHSSFFSGFPQAKAEQTLEAAQEYVAIANSR